MFEEDDEEKKYSDLLFWEFAKKCMKDMSHESCSMFVRDYQRCVDVKKSVYKCMCIIEIHSINY